MLFKRSRFTFFQFQGQYELKIAQLLRGFFEAADRTVVQAFPILQLGEPVEISLAEAWAVSKVPLDSWSSAEELDLDQPVLESLTYRGLLISDGLEDEVVDLRSRHEALERSGWTSIAALYYATLRQVSSRSDARLPDLQEVAASTPAAFAEVVRKRGSPPPAFFEQPSIRRCALSEPDASYDSALARCLLGRRTTREFDRDCPLAAADLSFLCRLVFGCVTVTTIADDFELLGKLSPSGGALHPIEGYAIMMNVEGFSPGIYHYNVRRHTLDLLREMDRAEAQIEAAAAAAGQGYVADAQVLFLFVARFERHFWKYHRISRTLQVMAMDVGHLGQTFYLACADRGLGALFSAAINIPRIETLLGLEPLRMGPLAVAACGGRCADEKIRPEKRSFEPLS